MFVRADFNVPLEKGKITDDTRIRGAIPTIKYLTSKGAKVLLSSHLGRPKGGYEAKFSLAPITGRLSELLGQPVPLVPDCIGVSVGKQVSEMKDGDVCLLENVRFYPEEVTTTTTWLISIDVEIYDIILLMTTTIALPRSDYLLL